jgi:hypothetical protein
MSSAFTKQLCDEVSRRWWQREAEATARALDQLRKSDWFPSTWETSRGAGSPLGTSFARPANETQKDQH